MRRWSVWLAIPLLALVGLGVYLLTSDDAKDRRVWSRFQAELTPENVVSIEIGPAKPVTLNEEEKGRAVTLLRQAQFRRSNRVGQGPTPDTILTLRFAGGRTEHIAFWGGDTFELSPRTLDPRTQFLVTSPALGEMIRAKLAR